jgi:hypothetical protein
MLSLKEWTKQPRAFLSKNHPANPNSRGNLITLRKMKSFGAFLTSIDLIMKIRKSKKRKRSLQRKPRSSLMAFKIRCEPQRKRKMMIKMKFKKKEKM